MKELLANKIHKFKNPIVRDTFIYTITDSIGKGVGFLLLPLVSFYVPPGELGIATNFVVLTSILSLLGGLAVVNSLPYFYYEQTHDQNKRLVSNLLIICLTLCGMLAVMDCFIHSFVYEFLKLDTKMQLYAILCVSCTLINGASFQLLRLQDKPYCFAGIQLFQIAIHCLLVVVFVIAFKWGGRGKVFADTGAAILLVGLHIYIMYKNKFLDVCIDKVYIKKLLRFGIPLLPHSLSFWLKSGMDKIYITQYGGGLYQNGLYSMAVTLMSIYTLISNGFFRAYNPALQKRLANITPENEEKEKRDIVRVTHKSICMFLLLALFTIGASWVVLFYIVDDKYENSFQFVPYLVAGLFVRAIYSFAIEFIYKKKKTLVLGIITFIGSVIQMMLAYFFIRAYGVIGAAYSSLIGSIIISIALFIYSRRVYPMPWFSFFKENKV